MTSRADRLRKKLAPELSGEQGGEIQLRAGLQIGVAELVSENTKLRRALLDLLDDKKTTYAVRVQRARNALARP